MLVSYQLIVFQFDQLLQVHHFEYVHHLYVNFQLFLVKQKYLVQHYHVYVEDFVHFVNLYQNHPIEQMFPLKEKYVFCFLKIE
jgi:hypothetical protein